MSHSDSDDFCEEAWRDRLLRTWFALQDEGRDPSHIIASWGGKKQSTAYAWKNGKCTPDTWTAFKLAKKAAADGYPQLLLMLVPDSKRLADVGDSLRVTGTITDNVRDLDQIQMRIWKAAEAGDKKALQAAANDLHDEADELAAEATTNFE